MAKISDSVDPLGVPPLKGEKTCPGPICTIVQNFTPIGATVAEIYVTGQKKTQQPINPSILTYGGNKPINTKNAKTVQ